jgi:hypothetical protein
MDPDPRIFIGIRFGNFKRAIGTAVIDNATLPIVIRLGQYALDTFRQEFLAVVNSGEHSHQRL